MSAGNIRYVRHIGSQWLVWEQPATSDALATDGAIGFNTYEEALVFAHEDADDVEYGVHVIKGG